MVSMSVAMPPPAQSEHQRLAITNPAGHESDSSSDSTSSACGSPWTAKAHSQGDVDSPPSLQSDKGSFHHDSESSLRLYPCGGKIHNLSSPYPLPSHKSGMIPSPAHSVSLNTVRTRQARTERPPHRLMKASSLNDNDDRIAARRNFRIILPPSPRLSPQVEKARSSEAARGHLNAQGAAGSCKEHKETSESHTHPDGAVAAARSRGEVVRDEAAVPVSNLPTSKLEGDASCHTPRPVLLLDDVLARASSGSHGEASPTCSSGWVLAGEGEGEGASGSPAVRPPSPCDGVRLAPLVLVSPRCAASKFIVSHAQGQGGGHVEAAPTCLNPSISRHRRTSSASVSSTNTLLCRRYRSSPSHTRHILPSNLVLPLTLSAVSRTPPLSSTQGCHNNVHHSHGLGLCSQQDVHEGYNYVPLTSPVSLPASTAVTPRPSSFAEHTAMLDAAWLKSFKDEDDVAAGPADVSMCGSRSRLRSVSSLPKPQQWESNPEAAPSRRVQRGEGKKAYRYAQAWSGVSQPQQGARAGSWLREPQLMQARDPMTQSSVGTSSGSNTSYSSHSKTNSCSDHNRSNCYNSNSSSPREDTGAGADDMRVGSGSMSRSMRESGGRGMRRCSSGVPIDLLASIEEMKEGEGRGSREWRQRGIVSVVNRVLRKGKSSYS